MSAYDDLVERLAGAIYNARAAHFGESPRNPPVKDERWELCVSYAIGALSEIHAAGLRIVPEEPTDEMVIGAAKHYSEGEWQSTERTAQQMLRWGNSASPYAPKDK